MSKGYFPFFVNIEAWQVLIVGGGRIAARRAETLSGFCRSIRVIAPELDERMKLLLENGQVQWSARAFESTDLSGADLVLACTNDGAVNEQIWRECRALKIPVNDCSDRNRCDFFFPGIARNEDVVIGVTAGGTDHRKAAEITKAARQLLGENYE